MAFKVLDLIGHGQINLAEQAFNRSNLAKAMGNGRSATQLPNTLMLSRNQKQILQDFNRYYTARQHTTERLVALADLELVSGRPARAVQVAKSCLEKAPRDIFALLSLARSLRAAGQAEASLGCLEDALRLEPDTAKIHDQIGETYIDLKEVKKAFDSFTRALSLDKSDVVALFNIGNIHKARGRLNEAVKAFSYALRFDPGHVEALNNRGATFQVMDRDDQAIQDFDAAIAIDCRHLYAWINKGVSHFKLEQLQQSVEAFDVALAIDPNVPDIFHNYGLTLMKMERYEEAAAHFDALIMNAPTKKQGYLSKGNALHAMRRYSEAAEIFQWAIDRFPDYIDAYVNMAGSLQELARHQEVIALLDKALEVRPGYSEALWNKANSMLPYGPSEEAWEAYEHRLHISVGKPLEDYGLPLLGNAPPDGKKLLIQWEQRFGDVIQMLRYAPQLAAVCDCHWQVADPMIDLFKASFPDFKTCTRGECPTGLDARTPYTSLPLTLKNFSVDTIPNQVSYLKASPQSVEKWRENPDVRSRRIGITWRGNPDPPGRTVPVDRIKPLLQAFSENLVALQMDTTPEEAGILNELEIPDLGNSIKTFDDSAGLLTNLDIVVTIDTAVAHLSGALGRKTLVMLKYGSDWRWMLERSDSPWYPTATLFRQSSVGDWTDVIERVSANIRTLM